MTDPGICTVCGRRIRYDRKTPGCYRGECASHSQGVVPQQERTTESCASELDAMLAKLGGPTHEPVTHTSVLQLEMWTDPRPRIEV